MMDLFNQNAANPVFQIGDVIVGTLLALVLALVLAEVYKFTHRTSTYSQQFLITMLMMAMATSIVMMIIGSNIARAFSLVGALSVIRFRTPVKDARDTAFIFMSMVVGMGCGTGFYLPVVVFIALTTIILIILHLTDYGAEKSTSRLLKVEVALDVSEDSIEKILKEHFKKISFINQTLTSFNSNKKINVYLVQSSDSEHPLEVDKLKTDMEKSFQVIDISLSHSPNMVSI